MKRLINPMHNFIRLLILAAFPVFLSGCEESPQPQQDQTQKKEQPAKEPDAAAIPKLIKRLGNPNSTEREEAVKALEAVGFPALGALRNAAKDNDAEVAQRAKQIVEIIEKGFDQLLEDYRGYGLPIPPADAKLVRFESGGRYILNDKLMPPTYFIGFLLRPGTKEKETLLLVGTQETRLDAFKTVEVVEPNAELIKSIELNWWGQSNFDLNVGLVIALQCKARGWNALAEELWIASFKKDGGHRFNGFYQPVNLTNRAALAFLAWAYSENELTMADTDRAKTAKRMKAVLAAAPTFNTAGKKALLKSLEAALVPSKAKPGSMERLIDDLTDLCMVTSRLGNGPTDSRYSRLADQGFAAVPALLEHLDDDRLTRSVKQGFNNFPTWNLRVKHVVSDLLQQLAGQDLGKDWLRRQQGYGVEKAVAQAWWDKAKKEGEEAYFLRNVLPADKNTQSPNTVMLDIISKKYPEHLPKLYKTILEERPNIESSSLAEAVATSSLPEDQKRDLFLHASRNKNLEHRRIGLLKLQKLDPQQFMTILLETLESLSKTPSEPYWLCPEAKCAYLVLATDDAKVWKLLEKVAKRSHVGLRMEFLKYMNSGYAGVGHRQKRLDFLAAFLDDAEAPDVKANPKMFEGPHAGFAFERLEIRDMAAMEISYIFGMTDLPDRNWTPEQWEKLRKRVKEGLKK